MENTGTYTNYRIPVPSEFEEVFSHFYYAKNATADAVSKTLIPSFQTILVFSFGEKASLVSEQDTKIEIDKCLVLGPIKHAFDYSLPSGAAILVANFKGDAFYRFFGNALLSGHLIIDPDELLEMNCFSILWHELKDKKTQQQIEHLLDFCKPYLKNRNATSALLANFNNEKLNAIKAIAEQTQQSERSVQLHHKKFLGYSAKEIGSYQRFLKAVEQTQNLIEQNTKPDWLDIVEHCGYYDQSQLIHDFQHFIHLSPTQFIQFQQDICRSDSR